MATPDLLLSQMIESRMVRQVGNVAEAAASLWEQLATEVISIVGESGFDALYARSLYLAQSTFPWLAGSSLPTQTDRRFTELKISLAQQTPTQANEANRLLLTTFTGIMASLIGEPLTVGILRSAWGNDASDRNGKEFNNE